VLAGAKSHHGASFNETTVRRGAARRCLIALNRMVYRFAGMDGVGDTTAAVLVFTASPRLSPASPSAASRFTDIRLFSNDLILPLIKLAWPQKH
jgi:hypothetical protein